MLWEQKMSVYLCDQSTASQRMIWKCNTARQPSINAWMISATAWKSTFLFILPNVGI